MNIATVILQNRPKDQTVFTTIEISQLSGEVDKVALHAALIYATNKGYLHRISKGIYALDRDYSRKEFANKYRRPSYISLYTVLQDSAIVFQPYSSVYAITNRSGEVEVDGQKYVYRKIKDEILLNPLGISDRNGVSTATPERAICDKLYLDGDEFFDNLGDIDWSFMKKLNKDVYRNNQVISTFVDKNIQ